MTLRFVRPRVHASHPPVQAQLQLRPVAERAAGQGFNIGSGFLQVWRVDREGGWQIFPYGLQTLAGTPNHTLLSAHAFADEPLPTTQSAHRLTAQGVYPQGRNNQAMMSRGVVVLSPRAPENRAACGEARCMMPRRPHNHGIQRHSAWFSCSGGTRTNRLHRCQGALQSDQPSAHHL